MDNKTTIEISEDRDVIIRSYELSESKKRAIGNIRIYHWHYEDENDKCIPVNLSATDIINLYNLIQQIEA